MLDTKGLENEVKKAIETLPEGELKTAYEKLLKETEEVKASVGNEANLQVKYNRLSEMWGGCGHINNMDPKFLETGIVG